MSGYNYDLPFDIMDIARILNLRIKRKGGKSVYTDCPLCGDKRGKMNLNLEKNQFRCNYCCEGGGAIQLYARTHGVNNSVAYREICEILYGSSNPKEYKPVVVKKEKLDLPKNAELASVYERNQTYEMLLSMLSLTSANMENLKKRGLSEDEIRLAGYKSTPVFGYDKMTKALIEKGCVVEGVPGFYQKKDGTWTMNFKSYCSGILIPMRTISGLIQGFQIRLDKPFVDEKGKWTKYIWFSSVDFEMGASSRSPVHFIGNPCDHTVFVTEGALKADIAHALSGRTFLAVAGAGNIQSLAEPFEILKQNGTQKISEAYDMDKTVNENIEQARKNLYTMVTEYGFEFGKTHWTWDPNEPEKNKGIDDMYLSKKLEQNI